MTVRSRYSPAEVIHEESSIWSRNFGRERGSTLVSCGEVIRGTEDTQLVGLALVRNNTCAIGATFAPTQRQDDKRVKKDDFGERPRVTEERVYTA